MRSAIVAVFLVCIFGCGSVPKVDDYAQHVGLKSGFNGFENQLPIFKLVYNEPIDIRGKHSSDDSINANPILYQGGAGVLGLFAQIATHAAINNAARNKKVSKAQIAANRFLEPLAVKIAEINIGDLADFSSKEYKIDSSLDSSGLVVNIRPIFFVAQDFEYITLKNIVSITKNFTKGSSLRKRKSSNGFHYQNLIEVYSRKYSEDEKKSFTSLSESSFMIEELQRILHQSLSLAAREIKGHYQNSTSKITTHTLKKNNSNLYIRGSQVDSLCQKIVIKNLRSWLVAIPIKGEKIENKELCNSRSGIENFEFAL